MKAIEGYHLITPEDLSWRPSNLMQIPNADFLERTGSENMGARLWRLPPGSANTWHKHIRAEEFYFVLEGVGRIRIGRETVTVPKHGGVLVGPEQLRQVFNDTETETLWLIIGAPEELEFPPRLEVADGSLAHLSGGSEAAPA
jgi:mannose-6-phosphate isomerase-like protein (cupin superfamily)